jgi:hypothetical protein
MQHDSQFTLEHPVIPLRDCPPHVREAIGLPKRPPA